ncbi:MAG TPA: hypothetical protein VM759_06480 [Longimicrobium sp.]|nr:hypothetical protein [Longimicrobium sp.]
MIRRTLVTAAAAVLALTACDAAPTAVRTADAKPAFSAGTLAVSISGPSQVPLNTSCTWFATPSGGTPPYEYRWEHLNLAWTPYQSADYVTWSFSASGPQLVKVTVRDAASNTAEAYQGLMVTNSASSC